MEIKPAEFIRLDLFPAQIIINSNEGVIAAVQGDARVIITNDMAYIFQDGPTGKPEAVFGEYLEEFEGSNREGYTVTTATGNVLVVTRSKGCGCGSMLRGFFPFPGVPFRFE